jgi:hypothetical protein
MSVTSYEELRGHAGHKIECVTYGVKVCGRIVHINNVSVECVTCNEVLMSFDKPEGKKKVK